MSAKPKNIEKKKTSSKPQSDIPPILGDNVWNIIFGTFLISTSYFITGSIFKIREFIENIKKYNLASYPWPKSKDLLPSIFILPIIIIVKYIIEKLAKYPVEYCMARKYKYPANKEMETRANIYRTKLARHIYKISYYTFITIFGYIVLKPLDFFPKSMLGNGSTYNLFIKGYPASHFFKKTKYFDLYYNTCLAYFSYEFITLLIMTKQSDFIYMLLHHVCTLSLIIFSFLTNYSNIGSLILFFHNQTDIHLHVVQFFIQTDHKFLTGFLGIVLMLDFIYMRQYVFGEIMYVTYNYLKDKWGIVNITFYFFLLILFIMHVRWSIVMFLKTIKLLFKDPEIIDIVNYNEEEKKKMAKLNGKKN